MRQKHNGKCQLHFMLHAAAKSFTIINYQVHGDGDGGGGGKPVLEQIRCITTERLL